MGKLLNLDGQRYGNLTVIGYSHHRKKVRIMKCLCDCGKLTFVSVSDLRSEHTKSCGCLITKILEDRNITHGMYGTKEYTAWRNIRARTTKEYRRDYERYGGRGITFQWHDDFEGFLAHIGMAPADGQRWSVERIDVNGNYEEGNIRWATDNDQAQNRRKASNNTSGVTGVAFHLKIKSDGREYTAAVAQVRVDGKNVTKSFSTLKYGLLESFALACKWREDMIKKLNDNGANYQPSHGK